MIYLFGIIVYLILCIRNKNNKLLLFLLVIQIVSLTSMMVIGSEDFSKVEHVVNIPFVILLTMLLIFPWKNYDTIKFIDAGNEVKLQIFTRFVILVSVYVFIMLSLMAVPVLLFVDDINQYKYIDGSTDFYEKFFPLNIRFYYLARLLYRFSYLLIPLHFYYGIVGNKKYSILCLLFSFNIILYGLAFFSRWTIALYALMFLFYWIMFRQLMPIKRRIREKKLIIVAGFCIVSFFAFVTISRFGTDNVKANNYEERIPLDSNIKDPSLYSIFSYLGQSNYYGLKLLDLYKGETFGGDIMLSPFKEYASYIGFKYDKTVFEKKRDKLWPDSFSGTFNGYVAYTVYDIGYLGAIILSVFYYFVTNIRKKKLTISELIMSAALVQMPLCSIFYSQIDMVISCLILYLPFIMYLRPSKVRQGGENPMSGIGQLSHSETSSQNI